MPLYLEPQDVIAELGDVRSVLIVPCPICPPMSLAMQKKKPFIEFFKHGLKTQAFEDYVRSVREPLEQRGIRTDVFTMRLPSPLMCLWTEGQRKRLVERAKDFEAVLVLGCNSATHTVELALKDTDCRVVQAMRMKAMANATMKFGFPMKVELEMNPLHKKRKRRESEASAGAAKEAEEKNERSSDGTDASSAPE